MNFSILSEYNFHNGAVAQLGERFVRNEEAVGSNPISSTKPSLVVAKKAKIKAYAGLFGEEGERATKKERKSASGREGAKSAL